MTYEYSIGNLIPHINEKRHRAGDDEAASAVEKSLSMVTSLNPHIGYEKASKLAKEAFKTDKTIRELCTE